jgi:glutathione S-transferase
MALVEKGIPFESIMLQFSKGEHKSEAHLKRNPRGKVPVLQDGDFFLYESKVNIISC